MNGSRSTTSTLTSSSESRLYVGNLAPAVDEFALVALFSKFGKISKLDFLFHKSGILRGKPRGYAFIEMSRKDEALKAMVELNNKPLRGKRILVTPANESQYQEHQAASSSKSNYHNKNQPGHDGRHNSQHGRGSALDPMRPTTLSLLKSQQQPKGVNNKIAALEAKLAAMQQPTNSLIEPSQAMGHCPKSSTNRPSSLPENPKTWLNNPPPSTASQNQPHNRPGAPASKSNSLKSSAGVYNKNQSLDAIGLTLKEQLRRNRDLKLSAAQEKLVEPTNHRSEPPVLTHSILSSVEHSDAVVPLTDAVISEPTAEHSDASLVSAPASAEPDFITETRPDRSDSNPSPIQPPLSPCQADLKKRKLDACSTDDLNGIKPVKPDVTKISWSAKRAR